MSYIPQNIQMFIAAFAGALAGMGASGRVPTNGNPADYTGLTGTAGAFAQAFDMAWGANPANNLDISSAEQLCEVAWQDRAPLATQTFFSPSNYTVEAAALVAMIRAGDVYIAGLGVIVPPNINQLSVLTAKTINAITVPLKFADGSEFTLENGKSYFIKASVMGVRIDAPDVTITQYVLIVARASGGIIILDDSGTSVEGSNAITISTPGALILRCEVMGILGTTYNWICEFDYMVAVGAP